MSYRRIAARLVSGLAVLVSGSILATALAAPPIDDTTLEEQRTLFKQVYASVERGTWKSVADLPAARQQLLEDYLLWPDLRAVYFRATIKDADHNAIDSFLDQYGTLKPARELRYRYALHLAQTKNLAGFLSIYKSFYQGLNVDKLDCLALQAEIEAGQSKRIVGRALEKWRVGESQAEECDPVFDFLRARNHLGIGEFRKRYELAIDAREFQLAAWLAKSIDKTHIDSARRWQKAQSGPESFVLAVSTRVTDPESLDRLAYAIERVTYSDPERALELWSDLKSHHPFTERHRLQTDRHIALWTARDQLAGAYVLLSNLPSAAQNAEVLRWRARLSLRNNDWQNLVTDIDAMQNDEKSSEEWQYWRAIGQFRSGLFEAANEQLRNLAGKRSYYGFLAADHLGHDYSFDHAELRANEAIIAKLAARSDLLRARELYYVGLDGRGRSEWDAVITYFLPEQKMQAAILAGRWEWHSRAISTAAGISEYDDLALRYPLPFQNEFVESATAANIPATWAYGIARSESIFMRDARSHAGAVGLMQLMPATGRMVAREIRLPYSGIATLTDPLSNIRLGTSYLSSMAARYNGNRVLATAAYNAGPHRVDKWRPEQGVVDARVWIENIPFNETRKYVRRVMAAETIFHWRITGQTRRLTKTLALVEAEVPGQQVASR